MSYYHIILEVNDHISTIEETRDIELFDITDLQPYLHSILLPYFNKQLLELDDDNIEFKDVLHLEIKQTLIPINDLIDIHKAVILTKEMFDVVTKPQGFSDLKNAIQEVSKSLPQDKIIIVNLSGRGDKDVGQVIDMLKNGEIDKSKISTDI